MKNIEIKYAVPSHTTIRQAAKRLGAKRVGMLRQVDTYFRVPVGRLKLRSINDRKFELIHYRRPDQGRSRLSQYLPVKVTKLQYGEVKKALTDALGIFVTIKKVREFWNYGRTRIHLDRVQGLGTFVELETVLNRGTMANARREHELVKQRLELPRNRIVHVSYSDLMSRK